MEEENLTEDQVLSIGREVLPQCFMVVDNEIHNEHASERDIVLYFHPVEVCPPLILIMFIHDLSWRVHL